MRRDAVESLHEHYRHTEGVGEMYEDRARWFSPGRGPVPRPSCPPSAWRTMIKPDPSSRRRPLSYTRAGASWQIIDPTATTAGPCNATFGSCDAEDRQQRHLLLLPALRLLRRLLRRCFRPSLLRHCCPPKLEWMATSVQCSRESTCTGTRLHYRSEKNIFLA
jgi:hypothetical protein